jgi:hypothetical protein
MLPVSEGSLSYTLIDYDQLWALMPDIALTLLVWFRRHTVTALSH